MIEIRPQPGPQTAFASTPADVALYGGAAFGGKTFSLLLDPLRHIYNPNFSALIFRRTTVQIKAPGGLWEESEKLYSLLGGRGMQQQMRWRFPSGMAVRFAHMEHDKHRFNWMGSQIPYIGFDEVTHFSEVVFWYMLSRNRSASGVPGYMRGTCNPDPKSWVRRFIAWYIDQNTGYAIPERSGVLRWFARVNDDIVWADTKAELKARFPKSSPMSFTFIAATSVDNKIGMAADPEYMAKLENLPLVEREQLKHGNWKISPAAGLYFKREKFGIVEAAPTDVVGRVRYWDRAATPLQGNNDPDATAGVKLSRDRAGVYYVEDVRKMYAAPHDVNRAMRNTAEQDGQAVTVGYMQDPGSAGVYEAQDTAALLDGFVVKFATATGDKVTRAGPISSQVMAGNVRLVRGPWNEDFLSVLENFPEGVHDDEVDALSGAHQLLSGGVPIFVA